MTQEVIELHISEDDPEVAYIALPGHPGRGRAGSAKMQVRLSDILSYHGPDVVFDLDSTGRLIGIEVLA
jgi:hypothetical protein